MSNAHAAARDGAAADVPGFPMARAPGCPFDPPPALRALRAQAPITKVLLWDESVSWLVTRYDDQRLLLADRRIGRGAMLPGFAYISARERARGARLSFVRMDDAEHARLRRMLTAPFAIRRIEALRPRVQQIVDSLIDEMLAGPRPIDLVQEFALPVPSLVICHLLGIPYADHHFFRRNAEIALNPDCPVDEALAAQGALIDYLAGQVVEKMAKPADDLLSRLALEQVKTGGMSPRALAVTATLLLAAGHETTTNMIALGTLALFQHPLALAALRDTDDPVLIADAVEELLRYLSVAHMGVRCVALADIEIGGQVIRRGDGVIFANNVANRDAEVFAEPDRLDFYREARGHLAFGFGERQCLGQQLARIELQVVYGTLYRRVPTLRLAVGLNQVPFKQDSAVYGVQELPVSW